MQPHVTFFLSYNLPLVAIPKRDSFLPLLLDIQTGGQRASSEIPAWGRELRGLSDKQPELGMAACLLPLCSVAIYMQVRLHMQGTDDNV